MSATSGITGHVSDLLSRAAEAAIRTKKECITPELLQAVIGARGRMNTAARRHTGLLFVPHPARDELLGAWLLRIAQLYGLGLTTILSRLAARPIPGAPVPHWFACAAPPSASTPCRRRHGYRPPLSLRWPRRVADRTALKNSVCARGAWSTRLTAVNRSLGNRHWMHPLSAVCVIHGTWLAPVATHTLARMHHATDFASLGHCVGIPSDEPACADDALWLQDLCYARTSVRPPWGHTRRRVMIRIVATIARVVMAASAAEADLIGSMLDRNQWPIKDFTLETEAGQRTRLWLPTRLRHRQRVLGTVAHLLRRAPAARSWLQPWSASMVKQLTWASTDDWPAAALEWICPEAEELVQRRDKLRK